MGICCGKSSAVAANPFELDVLVGHEGGINAMTTNDDGSILATASDDRTIRTWSTNTSKCECLGVFRGHESYVNCLLIEERYLISGSADATVRKWDIPSCTCILVMRGHTQPINRVISTGDFIFSSSYDRTARCWDFDTGQPIRTFAQHKRGVYPMLFIPAADSQSGQSVLTEDVIVTGSADFTAIVWSLERAEPIYVLAEHTGAINCLATDKLGRIVLTASTDFTVRSWSLADGQRLKIFQGHQSAVICMTVYNQMLYTGSSDHSARSWVIEYGDCTRIYQGHGHTVSAVRFYRGLVVTGCGDGIARCFDAKTGALKRSLVGHEVSINSLQVLGGRLFTGSHDKTVRIWEIETIELGDKKLGPGSKQVVGKDAARGRGGGGGGGAGRPVAPRNKTGQKITI